MSEDIKIYHVETQEDYDDLMVKLEEQGYRWQNGDKPTSINYWFGSEEETSIYLNENACYTMTHGFISTAKESYPDINIIKHKAKGVEQMEKVVVPQFVADWYEEYEAESLYSTLSYFLNGVGSTEELEQWGETCEGESAYPKVNAEKKIAKMHLYGYEVEEEKKYYWRKEKEYMFDFEEQDYMYLNVHKGTGTLAFGNAIEISISRTLFTETEVKQLVSKEDFNKLERVEIDDV